MEPVRSFPNIFFAAALLLTGISAPGSVYAEGADKKPITVPSDSLEADRKAKMVVFRGEVAAEEDFLLCSDELRLFYGDGDEIDEIVATGNVRIFQDERTSRSGKAVYDRRERTIVLTGEPFITQCTDTVKGEKITVYLDEDRAFVEGGEGGRVRAVIMPDKKCQGSEAQDKNPPEKGVSGKARCKGSL